MLETNCIADQFCTVQYTRMFRDIFSLVSMRTFLVSTKRKLTFILELLAFLLLLWQLDSIATLSSIPQPYFELLIVFLGANVLVSIVRFSIITSYRRRLKIPTGTVDNFVLGMQSISSIVVVAVTLASVLPIFSIPVSSFLTSASLFSVAFVWLFKEYLTNFFDSYRLMFSSDFKLGDYIQVNTVAKGVITEITFRATKLKTDEGDMVFIPNTTLMNSEVTNYSKVKFKRISIPFAVESKRLDDVNAFEAHLTSILTAAFPDLVEADKCFLRISGIENGYTTCLFEVSIDKYDFATEAAIKKEVYRTILNQSSVI